MDVIPVTHGIEKLDPTGVGAFQNGVPKLPHGPIFVSLQIRDAGEVVDEDGAHQPATTTQTGEISGRLQQTTQLTLGRRILRAAVKRLGSTGGVQHSPVATTRNRNGDVRQVGGVAGHAVEVPNRIELVNGDMAEEIPHGR